ncbi:uncharacterized protein LOC122568786 isoform X2 [Bombus pyrosoma]|uniref:uncharacterized protein LOC122568786 isoform X2 n=1 Tax=Bombus pyrosoma TaxID=396416 RepID=UPI001CB8A56F|nr:uncharacterized protein LOC122568786 isoform X2 [Bombus pyrosoma]
MIFYYVYAYSTQETTTSIQRSQDVSEAPTEATFSYNHKQQKHGISFWPVFSTKSRIGEHEVKNSLKRPTNSSWRLFKRKITRQTASSNSVGHVLFL